MSCGNNVSRHGMVLRMVDPGTSVGLGNSNDERLAAILKLDYLMPRKLPESGTRIQHFPRILTLPLELSV